MRGPIAFVGRERELDDLFSGLDDSVAGRGRLFLIAGEPGIGKSRLADEFATEARKQGCRVFPGRCWEAGGAPAYWPWVQSIRGYIGEADPESVRSQLGGGGAYVAQMLPELRDAFQDLPVPPSLDPETARFQLFDATTAFLRVAADAQPLVLLLDDLHAADTPSLLLLQFVARELGRTRIMIIGTYRDTELSRDRALVAALAELTREPATRSILLVGFTEAQVAAYIEQTTGRRPTGALVAALHRETEGNPLFVGEVVRLLDIEGRLDETTHDPARSLKIPQGVQQVIGSRLRHLSEPCMEILTLASVFGRDFRVAALERVSDVSRVRLLDLLDEAITARVVTDTPGGVDLLRFSHALIRDTLYEEIPASRRRRIHRQAGEALETLYAHSLEPHLAELAHHFLVAAPAGEVDRAVDYARRAGDRAIGLLAYEEAARLYQMALHALEVKGAQRAATRCELLLALGDALARAGETPSAKERFLEAARIAMEEPMPEQLARAALGYGGRFVWEASREDPHLLTLLQDALGALPAEDSDLRVRVMARLAAGPLRDMTDRGPRDAMSREAVEMARRLGEPAVMAYAMDGRYAAVWWPDNVDERLTLTTELIHLAEQAGDKERTLQGHHYRGFALLEVGDMPGVDAEVAAQIRLAEELKQPTWLFYVTTVRATVATLLGRFEDAERLIPDAIALGQRAESSMAEIYRALGLFNLRREQGRLHEVPDVLERVIPRFPTYFALRCALAATYCEMGREAEARTLFEELAADRFAILALNDEWLYAMGLLADVASHLRDTPRSEVLYALLLPFADHVAVSPPDGCTGSVSRNLGVLAAVLERADEAKRHFEDAIEMNRRLRARPWVARTQCDYAALLLRRDRPNDRESATRLLTEAFQGFGDLGLANRTRQVAVLLESLGAAPHVAVRATKTYMFTDIADSTKLVEAIGDEAWENLVRWHDRTLRSLFGTHGGEEVDHAGDGFLVAFDHGERAIRCAIAIQQRLAEHRLNQGFAPNVRVGVHGGEAVHVEGRYAGREVHRAARIASLAVGGQIVASRDAAALAGGFRVTDPRSVQLKGFSEPVEIVTIPWQGLDTAD